MIRLISPTMITLLPNPNLSDTEKQAVSIVSKRAMDNTRYSYVKSSERAKFVYIFRLTRLKSLELKDFVDLNYGNQFRLINHKSETWDVLIASPELVFTNDGKDEFQEVTIEFEGVKVNA